MGFEPKSGTPQAPRISVLPHAGPADRTQGTNIKLFDARKCKGSRQEAAGSRDEYGLREQDCGSRGPAEKHRSSPVAGCLLPAASVPYLQS